MSTQLKFTPITTPVIDIITNKEISNGYQLIIPFEIFKQYQFNAKLKLYSSTVDFLKTPFMIHAWTLNSTNGQMVEKETHINSIQWATLTKMQQTSAMHWPDIDQAAIEEFGYNVLLVVQPLVDSDIHEIHLGLEARVQY